MPHSNIKKIWDNLKLLHCLSWDSFWPPFNLFPKPTMILYIVSCLQNESEWQTLSSWTNSGHNSCGIYIHCKYSYHAHFPPLQPPSWLRVKQGQVVNFTWRVEICSESEVKGFSWNDCEKKNIFSPEKESRTHINVCRSTDTVLEF